jgi:hypothetical protein
VPQLQLQQRLLQLQLQHYNYNYSNINYNYNYTTIQLQLQLQLQNTTNTLRYTTPHYATLHPAVVVEVTAATTPKTQLQPPVGPSMDLLCHPCITTTRLSCGFLSLKPPPPSFAIPLEIPFFANSYWEFECGSQ